MAPDFRKGSLCFGLDGEVRDDPDIFRFFVKNKPREVDIVIGGDLVDDVFSCLSV